MNYNITMKFPALLVEFLKHWGKFEFSSSNFLKPMFPAQGTNKFIFYPIWFNCLAS